MNKYFRSIELSINPGAWSYFYKRKSDPRFASYFENVKRSHNNQCQFCGFKDREFMEVVNLDGNYKNNKVSNMVLACPFCSQCFFLEMVGKTKHSGGILIYLPKMSQVELNALCHTLFCAIQNGTKYAESANDLYNTLRLQGKLIENSYGEGLSNPAYMGQMMIDTPIDHKEQFSKKMLKDLRVLPLMSRFTDCIDHWSKQAMSIDYKI